MKIKSDFGSNFSGARSRQSTENNLEEEIIFDGDLNYFCEQAKSLLNIEFELHVPKAPFITGAAEKLIGMMKKCLHKMKHTSNLHQWFLTLQKIQSYLNRRPISLSNNLEILCPDVKFMFEFKENTLFLTQPSQS